MLNRKWIVRALVSVTMIGGGLLAAYLAFAAATITVTTTADLLADDGQCSLREAVIAANTDSAVGGCPAGSGADTIKFDASLPQPTIFTLTLTGAGEDSSATGDLDINSVMTIQGLGNDQTIVDGNGTDRVFDVLQGANLTLSGATVRNGNSGGGAEGSGIRSVGRLTISNSLVTSNQGSGITNDGGLATLTNVSVTNNLGHGIHNLKQGSLTYSGGEVSANQNGGIFNSVATATLSNLTVQNNSGAGGIANVGSATSRLTLTDSVVSNNTSATEGGGIRNDGAQNIADVRNTTISANLASAAGGGIFNFGILTLSGSTLDHNQARTGAGIDHFGGTLSMTNDTLSGNMAVDNGGGIYNRSSATLTNITLTGNTANGAGTGGNIFNDTASLSIKNSLVANSNLDGNCFNSGGSMNSLGHNLEDGNTCGFIGPSDLVNTNALLGSLQNNGGATFTHALLAGSLAIDHGDNTVCPATDQRGYSRPVDGDGDGSAVCDIGAYEVNGLVPTATKTATFTSTTTSTTIPTSTQIFTNTPMATSTNTVSPTGTPTETATQEATPTSTVTVTAIPTDTPVDTATATEIPPVPTEPTSTVGKVSGGGSINLSGKNGKATFGFVVRYSSGSAYPEGNFQYIDHVNDIDFSATSIDLLLINGNQAVITGTGIVNKGMEVRFTVTVYDYGEPGSNDQFMLAIPALDGYSAGGTISGGNIMIH